MGKRVVVIGGAGFVGSHLCERLINDGHRVTCLDNLSTGVEENVAALQQSGAFEFIRHDITEPLRLDGPIETVFHLGSPASPHDYLRLPLETLLAGSAGTQNAITLAHERKARFVLASTSEVYGDPKVHPQSETYFGNVNPIGPRSVYDEAKRYAEALTQAYSRKYGTNTAIVRIFNTYGPRMRPNDGRAVPTFIAQATAGRPMTVAGDGRQTRSLCYVDDLIDGLRLMSDSTSHGPVNLGNPTEITIERLALIVRDLTGSNSPIRFIESPEDDPRVRRPDINRARVELGWQPKVSIDDGLSRTIRWFLESCVTGVSPNG